MEDVLDRQKVMEIFKRLFSECQYIEGKSLKLMPPNADSVFSKGYQIHISPNNDEIAEHCITKIAKESDLAIANEEDTLIIFNPVKDKNVL